MLRLKKSNWRWWAKLKKLMRRWGTKETYLCIWMCNVTHFLQSLTKSWMNFTFTLVFIYCCPTKSTSMETSKKSSSPQNLLTKKSPKTSGSPTWNLQPFHVSLNWWKQIWNILKRISVKSRVESPDQWRTKSMQRISLIFWQHLQNTTTKRRVMTTKFIKSVWQRWQSFWGTRMKSRTSGLSWRWVYARTLSSTCQRVWTLGCFTSQKRKNWRRFARSIQNSKTERVFNWISVLLMIHL